MIMQSAGVRLAQGGCCRLRRVSLTTASAIAEGGPRRLQRTFSLSPAVWSRHSPSCAAPPAPSLANAKGSNRQIIGRGGNRRGAASTAHRFRKSHRSSTPRRIYVDDAAVANTTVRLSKRASELGICSRREADRILSGDGHRSSDAVFYVGGSEVTDGVGVKVSFDETDIRLSARGAAAGESDGDDIAVEGSEFTPYSAQLWDDIRGDTVVINKPEGCVSGQETHGHIPAVRWLTRANLHLTDDDGDGDDETKETLRMGTVLHFSRKKRLYSGGLGSQISKEDAGEEKERGNVATLSGYAPAGRLDRDSTGLLIFTRSGVMARRLIAPDSGISKEYFVDVVPADRPTRYEMEMGLLTLPPPTRDLESLLRGGKRLWNDRAPLKPLVEAEWIEGGNRGPGNPGLGGTLRLVLLEGKKRQIRRMCREILGMHVVSLVRTSVGPIQLDDLPEGKWRPLREEEVRFILSDESSASTKKKARKKMRPLKSR